MEDDPPDVDSLSLNHLRGRELLSSLSSTERIFVTAWCVLGFHEAEIARRMGVSRAAVTKWKQAVIRKTQAFWAQG